MFWVVVRRGRKRACITYCITYILSCITKHSPQYRILMIGRVLGGIATSLLFSAFESWLVAEHNKVATHPDLFAHWTLVRLQLCLENDQSVPP
jgi:predicted MFS family arabinose efflux permease